MEIHLKTSKNYVRDFDSSFTPLTNAELPNYQIILRAYSITRNIWVKDYRPLSQVVKAL